MTEYMMKTDKNGKPRYYKSVDGKMKVISRAEYEENVKAEVEEVKSEAIVPAGFWNLDAAITELAERDRLNSVDMTPSKPEDVALSVVKCIVSGSSAFSQHQHLHAVQRTARLLNGIENSFDIVAVLTLDGRFQHITLRFGADQLLVAILRNKDKAGVKHQVSDQLSGGLFGIFHNGLLSFLSQ